MWVVPKNAKNKDLAYDFIDITMRKGIQNLLGNNGGVPVAADTTAITDPKSKELIANFNTAHRPGRSGLLPRLAGPGLLRRARRRAPRS